MATARAEQEERDRAALARYQQAQTDGEQILQVLRTTSWDRADLARIRLTAVHPVHPDASPTADFSWMLAH